MIKGWYSPIKAGIYWTNGGGHSLVIYGYYEDSNGQNVSYMDPADGSFNTTRYNSFVSNSDFKWLDTLYQNKRTQ